MLTHGFSTRRPQGFLYLVSSLRRSAFWNIAVVAALGLAGRPAVCSASIAVNYAVAATGQTATADFAFADASTLVIALRETTPAGTTSLTGPAAALTALGFRLPAGQIIGGAVAISPGSSSLGFDLASPQLAGGADVSAEWGYTQGTLPNSLRFQGAAVLQQSDDLILQALSLDALATQKQQRAQAQRDAAAQLLANNPDAQMRADAADLIQAAEQDERDAQAFREQASAARAQSNALREQAANLLLQADASPDLHFVGVHDLLSTPFLTIPPGENLVGPTGLDGADAGLLGDAAAAGGVGVVVDSAIITLLLSTPYDASQQADFLSRVVTDSVVEYGSGMYGASTATPPGAVPAPSSGLVFVLAGLTSYRGLRRLLRPGPLAPVPDFYTLKCPRQESNLRPTV